jgi:hypothetical protein
MRRGKVESALSSLSKKSILLAEPNSQLLLFRIEWQSISIFARKLKSPKFSTYKNALINTRGINTSKIKEIKPTKMNTCRK